MRIRRLVSAGIATLILAGCPWMFSSGNIQFENNADCDIDVAISADGEVIETMTVGYLDPPGEGPLTNGIRFEFGEETIVVDVEWEGVFRSKQTAQATLVKDETTVMTIEPDRGSVTVNNYSGTALVLDAWLLPTDPTNYTTLPDVEAAAVCEVLGIPVDGALQASCLPATVYILYRSGTTYKYDDASHAVILNQDTVFAQDFVSLTDHPAL